MVKSFLECLFARGRIGIAVFALVCVCLPVAAEKDYTVKRNDTLTGLARENGLTVAELAGRNGLSKKARLRIGQKLIIPETTDDDSPSSTFLPKGLKKIRITPGKWKYIVIHHSASPNATVKGMDYYHRVERHMENGLAYHFVIGNGHSMKDGEIAIGHRWKAQLNGGHLASETLNAKSIGICLIGNFDREHPSKRQLDSLRELIEFLMARCHLGPKAVKTHQQINPVYTRCPGRYFPTKSFLKELREENG